MLDSGNGTTSFTYEPFGNLAQTTDPNGNVSTVVYDRLGRRTSLNDPDLGLRQYAVDPLGRIYTQSDPVMRAAAKSMSMGYDLLDRMIKRTEPDLTSVWTYDAPSVVGGATQTPAQIAAACKTTHSCGELIEASTIVAATGAKDYDRTQQYDALGRPSSQVVTLNAVAYTSGTSYDTWGREIQQTSQRGTDPVKAFDNRYNAYGDLWRLERQGLPLWTATTQDQLGHVTVATLGNQLVDNAQFDLLTGRLSAAQLTNNGQAQIQESYFYDALGNATTRSELWGSGAAQKGYIEFLGYDNLNRLQTSQLVGGALQNFTYDAAGDILTKAGVGTGNYVYPTQGAGSVRPHAVQSITGVTGSFGYDANGNMTSSPFGRTQTWTSFDMPLVLSQGANSSQFYYGPEHQRAKQVRSDGTTIWYAGGIEVETSASQTRVKTYWPHGLGLEIDSGGATQELWTHVDRLGSVVAVTDVNGTLQVQDAFDVWGTRRNTDGTAAAAPIIETLDNKGFTGQEMLDQLALVHLNGRVYDPNIGRFISGDPLIQDPTNGQSYNRYSYVTNNPTNFEDPTGFCETVTGSAICFKSKEAAAQVAEGLGTKGTELAREPSKDGSTVTVRHTSGGTEVDSPKNPSVKTGGGDAKDAGCGGHEGACHTTSFTSPTAEDLAARQKATLGSLGSMGLDALPLVGTGKSALQLGTGKDAVTGEDSSRWANGIGLAAGVLPFGKVGVRLLEDAAVDGEKLLFRRGASDTKALLQRDAQAAENVLGIHGVSVSSSPAAKAGQVVRCASCSSLEAAGFTVHKTGGPNHYTVELPKTDHGGHCEGME